MDKYQQILTTYIDDLKATLDKLPQDDLFEILDVLNRARRSGRTVFICGNGGSAATAGHMVCDFSKNTRLHTSKRIRVVGLSDNISTMTAYANDEGYDRIFAEPIINLIQPEDILIAISGSGNSPNVLRGVEAANQAGATTIGLTGMGGGRLKDLVDIPLVVPSKDIDLVEDLHLIIDHILTRCLRLG